MNTPEKKCEKIPVSQGKFITLESAHVTILNFGTVKCSDPLLIHTNVIRMNANGLCAFCLEQKIDGADWKEFGGYPSGYRPFMSDPICGFLVCNKCMRLSRIKEIMECDEDDNWTKKSIFMKYAREDDWCRIGGVGYDSD